MKRAGAAEPPAVKEPPPEGRFFMQYKFFTVPAMGADNAQTTEELNVFLRTHRILTVQRELVNCGAQSCWCCCVEYLEGGKPAAESPFRAGTREKVDYRNVLSEADFAKFRILRECRKAIAEADAVPAYAVFLDEHLAEMSRLAELTLAGMRKISGVGEKKSEKYGTRLLALFEEKSNASRGESVSENSGS